jgi:hypothetical protein
LVSDYYRTVNETRPRIALQGFNLNVERSWEANVVVVKKGDIPASACE